MDPESTPTDIGMGSSKAIQEPLLKSSEGLDEEQVAEAHSPSPNLLYYPGFGYIHDPRPYRDVVFIVIFVFLTLASIAWGIFAIINHNTDYGLSDSALYNSSSGLCSTYSAYGRSSLKADLELTTNWERTKIFNGESNILYRRVIPNSVGIMVQSKLIQSFTTGSLITILVWTLIMTIVLSVPLLFGFLWLLKAFAKQFVYACLPFFIVIPAFLNIFWFVACNLSAECGEAFSLAAQIAVFVFVFLLCGIFVWIMYSNWHRIELTIRVMQTAAQALLVNWVLLLILPILSVVLLIYLAPFIVFLIYAYMNGTIVPTTGLYCEGEAATDCCSWATEAWVPAYYVLTIFTIFWSILLAIEAQVYVISSTAAQWYFAVPGSPLEGNIRRALKHAFGPSFGTVSFAGLVLVFVRAIRAAVDSAQDSRQQGFFFIILRCCVNFVLVVIEFLNKFTINFAAITGESYCNSARMSYDLLKRNLLSPVFVEVISTRLLAGMAFVISVLYAIAVCAILKTATDAGGAAYYITFFAWMSLFILFILFNEVLDNIIDTIYICYAMDKDSGAVSQAEIHDIYLMLPVSRDQPPALAVQQA